MGSYVCFLTRSNLECWKVMSQLVLRRGGAYFLICDDKIYQKCKFPQNFVHKWCSCELPRIKVINLPHEM